MDVPGLITTFSPLITEMEVYYDVDDKYGPVRFPSGIEEKYSDLRSVSKPGRFVIRGSGFTKSSRPAGRVGRIF